MAGVWKRPRLTALEVLWRWTAGLPFLALAVRALTHALRAHPFDMTALEAMTVFEPAAALRTLQGQIAPLLGPLRSAGRWLFPGGVLAWTIASAAGRLAIWRQLGVFLPGRFGPVAAASTLRIALRIYVLGLLRLLLLLLFFWMWFRGIGAAARYSIFGIFDATHAASEPNLVGFAAIVVVLTLALFLLWSLAVWLLDAAPLFALAGGEGVGASLRSALAASALRSELIEINLVMGIVKVGLLVLAMVFSATPLPFAAEETTGFLVGWWSFVGVLFLVALDFFHVVRRAANLSFFETLITRKGNNENASKPAE